mmetsp:Transcript_4367/g.8094  ORF Transcript_4367/g.8094 Transcript_4367/m.8094 type:complete len:82 (-) Transcript_4367:339-584(-)
MFALVAWKLPISYYQSCYDLLCVGHIIRVRQTDPPTQSTCLFVPFLILWTATSKTEHDVFLGRAIVPTRIFSVNPVNDSQM